MSLGRAFVFVEVADRGINALFDDLHRTIYGTEPQFPPHLTVRGPYPRGLPPGLLEDVQAALSGTVFEIGGAGRFANPGEHTVYLKVDGGHALRDVWHKPDYPVSRYGYNPHLSLYRGEDERLADELEGFFRGEALRLLCAEFRVLPHLPAAHKHGLPFDIVYPVARGPYEKIIGTGMRPGLVDRLAELMRQHRRGRRPGSRVPAAQLALPTG